MSFQTRFSALQPCDTLQHTATHCNTLQHTATHIAVQAFTEILHTFKHEQARHAEPPTGTRLCGAVCCSVCSALQCVAVCCSVVQCAAVCCSALLCVAACCSVLQCVAACCSVLQCVAVCYSVMQWLQCAVQYPKVYRQTVDTRAEQAPGACLYRGIQRCIDRL